jgi:hypothetical protein
MSKRLEALLKKYEDENEFHFHHIDKENIIFPAMIEYAREVAQASLERASEKVVMNYHDGHHKTNTPMTYVQFGADNIKVQKESITNPDNIVL